MARICREKYQKGGNYRVRKVFRELQRDSLKSLNTFMSVLRGKLFRLGKEPL